MYIQSSSGSNFILGDTRIDVHILTSLLGHAQPRAHALTHSRSQALTWLHRICVRFAHAEIDICKHIEVLFPVN